MVPVWMTGPRMSPPLMSGVHTTPDDHALAVLVLTRARHNIARAYRMGMARSRPRRLIHLSIPLRDRAGRP